MRPAAPACFQHARFPFLVVDGAGRRTTYDRIHDDQVGVANNSVQQRKVGLSKDAELDRLVWFPTLLLPPALQTPHHLRPHAIVRSPFITDTEDEGGHVKMRGSDLTCCVASGINQTDTRNTAYRFRLYFLSIFNFRKCVAQLMHGS